MFRIFFIANRHPHQALSNAPAAPRHRSLLRSSPAPTPLASFLEVTDLSRYQYRPPHRTRASTSSDQHQASPSFQTSLNTFDSRLVPPPVLTQPRRPLLNASVRSSPCRSDCFADRPDKGSITLLLTRKRPPCFSEQNAGRPKRFHRALAGPTEALEATRKRVRF